MRIRPSRLFLLLSAAALSFGVSACKDDPEPVEPDFCDENPDAEQCKNPDFCDENPDAEECQTGGDTCDTLEEVMLEQLNIHDTAAPDLPSVSTETVSKIGETNVSNYRYLTFTLPSSGQPGTDTPQTSKLYLDFDTNSFLDISDQEALTNNDWDIAFDGKNLNYVYANSGHSGGFTGSWPAGLMLAELDGAASEADFIAIDATDTQAIPFAAERWINAETCEPELTDWLPMLQPQKVLPKTTIGAWYTYDFDGGHQMIANPTGYAIYNSANQHHVYKIKFLNYDSSTLEVKIAVHDQFQQNACNSTKEINAVTEAIGASDVAQPNLPNVTVAEQPDVSWDGEDRDGNPVTIDGKYRKLSFTLPEATEGASKLYLNIQKNEFVSITDREALGLDKDEDDNVIRKEGWDIAIDLETNNTYLRSGQSAGYTHKDKYVPGWAPRGMMGARTEGVTDEDDFTAWNSGEDTSIFRIEDYIDHENKECTLSTENDLPATIIGADLFDVNNDAAFAIYTSGACHKVFQFKTLSFDETTREAVLGVILANPGVPAPGCN